MDLKSIHKKVESVFEFIKKGSNLLTAFIIFLIALYLFSFWGSLPSYGDLGIEKSLELTKLNLKFILGETEKAFSAFFFIIIPSLFIVGKIAQISNKKLRIDQIFYMFGIGIISFVLFALIIPLIMNGITGVELPFIIYFIVFLIPSLYFFLVSLKTGFGTNYGHTLAILVLFYFVFKIVTFAYIFISFQNAVAGGDFTRTDTEFNFNITNHTDGSFTAMYAEISKETGEIKEACYVRFLKGWDHGNNETIAPIVKTEKNISIGPYSYQRTFYKKQDNTLKEYFIFTLAPPISYTKDSISNSFTRASKKQKENWTKESIEEEISSKGVEYLDEEYTNSFRTITRHEVILRSPVGLGYEFVYQSSYGKDEDFYYIIENTYCEVK